MGPSVLFSVHSVCSVDSILVFFYATGVCRAAQCAEEDCRFVGERCAQAKRCCAAPARGGAGTPGGFAVGGGGGGVLRFAHSRGGVQFRLSSRRIVWQKHPCAAKARMRIYFLRSADRNHGPYTLDQVRQRLPHSPTPIPVLAVHSAADTGRVHGYRCTPASLEITRPANEAFV